ncbi:hypothetical protein RCL1_000645 [Eukaryota sp. TZLM3-RCL]
MKVDFFLFLLLFAFALGNPSWSFYNEVSSHQFFKNLTIESSLAFNSAIVRYKEADCNSLVIAWLTNTHIHWYPLYCYHQNGHWRPSTGFSPFSFLMEQYHAYTHPDLDFPLNPPSRYRTFERPTTYSLAVADSSTGFVVAYSWCRPYTTDLYFQYTHTHAYSCGTYYFPATCYCYNCNYDRDRDVLGQCAYRLIHSMNLHDPTYGARHVNFNSRFVLPNMYEFIDIPTQDGDVNHANPMLPWVDHLAGSVIALKDLDGDGIPDLIVGGVIRGPTARWGYLSGSYSCGSSSSCCYHSRSSPTCGFSHCARDFDHWDTNANIRIPKCDITVTIYKLDSNYNRGVSSNLRVTMGGCNTATTSSMSCTTSWLQLNNNPKPDLLVYCSDDDGVELTRVLYDLDLTGSSSNGPFVIPSNSPMRSTVPHSKMSVLPLRFRNFPTVTVSNLRAEPLLTVHQVSGKLSYRHLFNSKFDGY